MIKITNHPMKYATTNILEYGRGFDVFCYVRHDMNMALQRLNKENFLLHTHFSSENRLSFPVAPWGQTSKQGAGISNLRENLLY